MGTWGDSDSCRKSRVGLGGVGPKTGPSGTEGSPQHLVVDGVEDALAFYERAFGAKERRRILGPDGRVARLEVAVGDFMVVLRSREGTPRRPAAASKHQRRLRLRLRVRDCDAATCGAWEWGGRVLQAPHETSRGERAATVRDPFGLVWRLTTSVRDARCAVAKSS
jgi:PhnB protein